MTKQERSDRFIIAMGALGLLMLGILFLGFRRMGSPLSPEGEGLFLIMRSVIYFALPISLWELFWNVRSTVIEVMQEMKMRAARARTLDASGFVYLIRAHAGLFKIGMTRDPHDRLRTFSVKLPFEVRYEHLIPCSNRFQAENVLHRHFAKKRVGGEWFRLDKDDLKWIKGINAIDGREVSHDVKVSKADVFAYIDEHPEALSFSIGQLRKALDENGIHAGRTLVGDVLREKKRQ